MNNYLKFKYIISELSLSNITLLNKYYDIPAVSRNDNIWLLVLAIMQERKSNMLRAMYKPKSSALGVGELAKQYNINKDECNWPTRSGNFDVQPCNMNIEHVDNVTIDNKVYNIVKVPYDTKIFHGTKIIGITPSSQSWSNKNMTWFATTLEHTMPLGPFVIYEFTIDKDLILLFEQNITNNLGYTSGQTFMIPFMKIAEKIFQKYNIQLDGYIGCNECEIGLFKNSLGKLMYPPIRRKPLYIE